MENDIPQMTHEQIAAMQQQQEMQTTQLTAQEEDVSNAQELLGINEQNATIAQQNATIAQQGETVEAMGGTIKAMKAKEVSQTMAKKYPDVPIDIVEAQIEKLSAINPEFAESMRNTEVGAEMAYQSAIASISPTAKPDNLTDGEGTGDAMATLEEAVAGGTATDFQLGDSILAGVE